MSLSDKFYEGLSAPIPVVGAQLPDDMTAYAGGPLDPLKQHKQKYKQIEYMQRLSDRESKRLLKQLEESGDVGDMNKTSFVGSNPISRRAYLMSKLADEPLSTTEGDFSYLPDDEPGYSEEGDFSYMEPMSSQPREVPRASTIPAAPAPSPAPRSRERRKRPLSTIEEIQSSLDPQQDIRGADSFMRQEPPAGPALRSRERPLSHDEKIKALRGLQQTFRDDSSFGDPPSPRSITIPAGLSAEERERYINDAKDYSPAGQRALQQLSAMRGSSAESAKIRPAPKSTGERVEFVAPGNVDTTAPVARRPAPLGATIPAGLSAEERARYIADASDYSPAGQRAMQQLSAMRGSSAGDADREIRRYQRDLENYRRSQPPAQAREVSPAPISVRKAPSASPASKTRAPVSRPVDKPVEFVAQDRVNKAPAAARPPAPTPEPPPSTPLEIERGVSLPPEERGALVSLPREPRQPAAPAAKQPAAPASRVQVPANLTRAPVRYQAPESRAPAAPGSANTVRSRYVVPASETSAARERRFVGRGREENIGNSGQLINRLQEFNRGYRAMSKDPRMVGPSPEKQDNRGFFQRLGDGIYHYGSRAARGLSTGAQMGASYLYDTAQDGGYLDSGSFLGDKLDDYGLRGSLNEEMARINASLAHSYGYTDQEDQNDRNANLYANRLRGIDTDLTTDDIQARTDLLSREAFRNQLLDDQMTGRFKGYTDEQRKAIRESRARNIDNFYGFEGNTAGMPSIRDDITGTSFRNALNELQDGVPVNPAKEQARAAALEEMMAGNPAMATAIQEAFGAEAEKAGVPLAQFAAKRLARDLNYNKQLTDAGDSRLSYDDVYETDEQRLNRYEQTRDFTNSILESMNEEDRGNFIAQMNPRVVQRAEQISSLMDSDPEEALRMVNDMDPQEARFLLDQISMLSKYVSPDMAQTALDASRYQVREDKDDFFPSFGGTDLVNPALQQVGAGGDYSQMTGDARDRVFGFNSMQDAPASEGEFFLVDDGNVINTYYNPTTGEVNRELFTSFGNANKALPREFYDQFYKRFGYIPNYKG